MQHLLKKLGFVHCGTIYVTTEATTAATTTEAPVTTVAETTTAVTTTVTEPAPQNTKGDADNNGSVNTADIVALIQHLVGKTDISGDGFKNADMNSDNKLSVIDLIMLKNSLA